AERVVERPLRVDAIELPGVLVAQVNHAQSDDAQPGAFHAPQDFSDEVAAYRVRLDHHQRPFHPTFPFAKYPIRLRIECDSIPDLDCRLTLSGTVALGRLPARSSCAVVPRAPSGGAVKNSAASSIEGPLHERPH